MELRVAKSPKHNDRGRSRDPIRVAVRIRPRTKSEIQNQAPLCMTLDPTHQSINLHVNSYGAGCTRNMKFDACLGESATQRDVIELLGIHQLLDAISLGFNVCILAYGPTGSGKTYTMTGNETQTGLVQNAMEYLFKTKDNETHIEVSYLEIYNESVFDLLGSHLHTPLPVKWHKESGYYVVGKKSVLCKDLKTLEMVLRHGLRNRRSDCTTRNSDSSRSHTLFTIHCTTTDVDGCTTTGKLTFVDLAGSERLNDGSRSGVRNPMETAQINRSLFCLGNMILALSARYKNPEICVPYRDSILTRLLMESLMSPESLTLLITCCSPCGVHIEEVFNTLNYAQKAMSVVQSSFDYTKEKRSSKLIELKLQIDELRKENVELKEQLRTETGVRKTTFDSALQISSTRNVPIPQELVMSDSILQEIQDLRYKLHNLETRLVRDPGTEYCEYSPPILHHRDPLLSPAVDCECHTELSGYQSTDPPTKRLTGRLGGVPDLQHGYRDLNRSEFTTLSRRKLETHSAGVITANKASLRFLTE